MAGVDLVSVQKILGHQSIQTTLRYSHLDPAHLQKAVNRGSLLETDSATVAKTVTSGMEQRQEKDNPLIIWCARLESNQRPSA